MSRRAWKWLLPALAVLLVAALVAGRLIGARRAAAPAAGAPAQAVAMVELAPGDVVRARRLELTQGLPLTGTLRAADTAMVKARVAGELRDLHVREGDTVKAGEVIARIDATEYQAREQQARQQADAARAQVDIAQRQYDNNRALVDQGFISKTALDTSLANLNAARANWHAAQAAVEVAHKTLGDTVLTAPIAGVVSQRLAQPGERVGVDTRIVELIDPRRLEFEAILGAGDAVRLAVGQRAHLRVDGVDQPVAARVVRLHPSAQAGSRSVPVYLALEPAPGLRPGLFAQGTLETGRVTALAVPLSALRTDKPVPYVQQIENDQVVHRQVMPGARGQVDGEPVVAVEGLPDGAVLATGAVGTLREGTKVRFTALKPPLTPPPAAAASGAPRAGSAASPTR